MMDPFFTRLALSNDIRPRLGRHLMFWTACWIFQGFIYGFLHGNEPPLGVFFVTFSESLMYLPQHIFLSYSIIYFVLPQFIFKGKYWLAMIGIVVLVLITALMSPVILESLILPFRSAIGFPVLPKSVFSSFMGGLRGSMTVAGFAVAIKLVKHWYLKKTENERLEREKLKTELELLKGQLHPHFMFNTLNTIYSMALKESSRTAQAVLQLSNLMRYMIAECKSAEISLAKEIQILRTYIELEKSRLGNRLDQTMNIQGDLEDKKIAPLLLLPFVENSFKHGAYETVDQAWLSLDIRLVEDELTFKLINGKGQGSKPQNEKNSGIGLQNVKKRLSLLYPSSHELRITEDEAMFMVSLTLFLNKIALPAA